MKENNKREKNREISEQVTENIDKGRERTDRIRDGGR